MSTQHTITITVTTDDDNEITDLSLEKDPGMRLLHGPVALLVLADKLITASAQAMVNRNPEKTLEDETNRIGRAVRLLAFNLTGRTEEETVELHENQETPDAR